MPPSIVRKPVPRPRGLRRPSVSPTQYQQVALNEAESPAHNVSDDGDNQSTGLTADRSAPKPHATSSFLELEPSTSSIAAGEQPPTHSTPSQEKVSKQKRRSNLFRIWWLETVLVLVAVGAIIGIVLVIYPYRNGDRSIPKWPGSISVNTVISLLTLTLRAALTVILAETLSQQKWNWFRQESQDRVLFDMQAFDSASRGIVGSFFLLFRRSSWANLGALGAVTMLMTIAIGPFAQQLIDFDSCNLVDSTQNATIARAGWVEMPGLYNSPTALGMVPASIRSAVYAAVYAPNFDMKLVNCPSASGNCEFNQPYHTLGFRSTCQDISEQIVVYNSTEVTEIGNTDPSASTVLLVSTQTVTQSTLTMFQGTQEVSTPNNLARQADTDPGQNVYWTSTVSAIVSPSPVDNGTYVQGDPDIWVRNFSLPSGAHLVQRTRDSYDDVNETLGLDKGDSRGFDNGQLRTWVLDGETVSPPGRPPIQEFWNRTFQVITVANKIDCTEDQQRDPRLSWQCRGWGAAQCTISTSLSTRTAKVIGGIGSEMELNHTAFSVMPLWYLYDKSCLSSKDRTEMAQAGYNATPPDAEFIVAGNGTSGRNSYLFPGDHFDVFAADPSARVANCVYGFDNTMSSPVSQTTTVLYSMLADLLVGSVSSGNSSLLDTMFNDSYTSFPQIESLFNTVGAGITNGIRTFNSSKYNADNWNFSILANQNATGTVLNAETCIKVRWPWLTYLVVNVLLTILYLVFIISTTHKNRGGAYGTRYRPTGVWKSDLLPHLFYSLGEADWEPKDESRLLTRSELANEARRIRARLTSGDGRWRLVPAKND